MNNAAERGEEDDIEETDEEYSARVERMRQMHMAREKKKNLRRSILLYDEDDLNNGGESLLRDRAISSMEATRASTSMTSCCRRPSATKTVKTSTD